MAGVSLTLAATFAIVALTKLPPHRTKVFELSGALLGIGLVFALLKFFAYTLPSLLSDRRSPTIRRRREWESLRRINEPSVSLRTRSDGHALILALLLAGALAGLLLQAHAIARERASRENDLRRRLLLRSIATEAARFAVRQLAVQDGTVGARPRHLAEERAEYDCPAGARVRTVVRDEQSRFDLNNLAVSVPPGQKPADLILIDLLLAAGEFSGSPRARSLLDFLDPDRNGPRETDFYRRLDPAFRVADRPLLGWRELLHVEGWHETLFLPKWRQSPLRRPYEASLSELATLIPRSRTRPVPINVNTASPDVLRAVLGAERERLVELVTTLRGVRPIGSLEALRWSDEVAMLEPVMPYLDVRSRFYRIRALAESEGHELTVEALVERVREGHYSILQWAESAEG